jgi:hypothetical protein
MIRSDAMKTVRRLLVLVAVGLSACSAATLPFKPETPPPGSAISADYMFLADRLRVEIDTGGYRLEDAQLVRAEGAAVRPQTIENPPPGTGSSVGFGIGMGGANYGRGGAVGVGTGVGMEVPVGSGNRVQGNTLLYFVLDQIGPPPWRLNVKVAETNPATIVLPPR